MKKAIIAVLCIAPLAACTPTERGATVGAASGGAIGAALGGDAKSALAGAAVGGAAGALLGKASEGNDQCRYRDRRGRTYVARCPNSY
ncbi:YMGG-like glycine zipper-containing protein [Pararhizobium mangrovi]|uniref:YMGG-like Gly-zipper domain-containing protein n=1 Tax=Pararhizobium mangrovi TaxID=2590452 RepID=A0A506U137_9HYPH|nr:YMGG-like glycine zipper-containing protein [Pararhizobium mangrovi]TPW26684.1 hypothetical protein FJU11_13855 [Pararhizobium mangrovi]